MTTKVKSTNAPTPSEAPPVTEVGVLGWIKENLFNSWGSAILTILSGLFIFVALRVLIRFIFFQANWEVVYANPILFLIGQYPREEAWRTAAALGLVIVMAIIHALFWKRSGVAQIIISILWFLSFPTIWFILAGFENSTLLPPVRTQLWSGLLLTVMLTVVGIVVSFPLGVILALGRRSDLIIAKILCTIYIEAIRGVPLISILFMSQVMLPLFVGNTNLDVVIRAMAGVTLFSAAYVAENVRGGLQAIPNGQVEAAQALGLSAPLVTVLIVLPQALRIVIPAIVGQFISLFKDTTLVSIITLLDLLGIAASALAQKPEYQFHKTEVYLFLAVIYFIFSYLMSSAARRIEATTSAMGGTQKL